MGNSDRTRLIVLTACAVILALLLFTVANWAERRVADWSAPSPASIAAEPGTSAPQATQRVCNSPVEWIVADDYPAEAIRADQEGTTRIRWSIGDDGWVTSCEVEESSGHAVLDDAACSAIKKRGCYSPVPLQRTYSRRVVWRLPTAF